MDCLFTGRASYQTRYRTVGGTVELFKEEWHGRLKEARRRGRRRRTRAAEEVGERG